MPPVPSLEPGGVTFAYQRLMEMLDIDQTSLANLLSVDRSTVSHCVNFRTRLSSEIVDYCLQHKVDLGFGHFRELARLAWYPKELGRKPQLTGAYIPVFDWATLQARTLILFRENARLAAIISFCQAGFLMGWPGGVEGILPAQGHPEGQ